VEITKDADFNGEIKTKRISVEDGAYLKAAIELEREPQKKAVPIGKPAEDKASSPEKAPITLVSEADKGN
jgi:cytoskeletal protein CcmA (bactofilin family)